MKKIIIWNANMCDKFFYDRLQFLMNQKAKQRFLLWILM